MKQKNWYRKHKNKWFFNDLKRAHELGYDGIQILKDRKTLRVMRRELVKGHRDKHVWAIDD